MVAIAREIRTGAAPMTDIRDQLAQIRSILDGHRPRPVAAGAQGAGGLRRDPGDHRSPVPG